jgi:hypothetical protein
VAVLEYMGSAEAQEFLKQLASGSEHADLTRRAKAAGERLAKRAALNR